MIIEKMTLQALVLIACAPSAILAANTFTAVSGSDWNTAANWSEGVPVAVWHGVLDEDRDRVITGDMKRVEIATTHPDYLGATTAAGGFDGGSGKLLATGGGAGTVVFLTVVPPAESMIIVR